MARGSTVNQETGWNVGLGPTLRGKHMYLPLRRLSALALLAICASCSNKEQIENGAGTAQSDSTGAAVASESGSPAPSGQDLARVLDALVAQAADLPRAEFDPTALAARLGKNPEAQFEWVREKTWWAPYRGLLRGSKGVMLDRVGSNLDRAVLLGELLRQSGYPVRLARAELTEARAAEVLRNIRPIPAQRRPTASAMSAGAHATPEILAAARQLSAKSQRAAEEARSLARSQGDQLYSIVRGNTNGSTRNEEQLAVAAMRDYWWGEYESGGKWVALDVAVPDSRPGTVLVQPSSRVAWSPDRAAPEIAEGDWHSVQISVVAERYENGALTESTTLKTILKPALIFDRQVTLVHMADPWPQSLPDAKTDPNALGNAAVNVRTWIPVLRLGPELVAQSGMSDGADLKEDPLSPQKDINEVAGGSLFGGLDTALAGGESAASYMTAEWIDFEIRVPGQSTTTVRRPIFDLLGPVDRAAKVTDFDASTNERMVQRYEALLSKTDILLQPCEFSGEFVANLYVAGILAEQSDIRKLSKERDPAEARKLASDIIGRIDYWGPLPDVALWRSYISGESNEMLIDRPNILNYRMTRPVVSADQVPTRQLVDFAFNATSVRPGAAQNSFEARLRQGVADTVAEQIALGSGALDSGNTASLFAAGGQMSDASALVSAHDSAAIGQLGWQGDPGARLLADVKNGYAVVALKRPVSAGNNQRVGWWRIDPTTGNAIGVMDNGYHAASSEDAITRARIALREYLDDEWVYWAQQQVTRAGGNPVGAAVEQDLAIRQAAIAFRKALLEYAEAIGARAPLSGA